MVLISAAEIEVMIIAANIPSFKALWVNNGWKAFWESSKGSNKESKPSDYEMTPSGFSQQQVSQRSKPKKEIGIDTELGLRDESQEELVSTPNTGSAKSNNHIQVTHDFTVRSESANGQALELQKQKNDRYYVGSGGRMST
jgi:DNA-directed RNA polymerase alpha subunit